MYIMMSEHHYLMIATTVILMNPMLLTGKLNHQSYKRKNTGSYHFKLWRENQYNIDYLHNPHYYLISCNITFIEKYRKRDV